ncbi:acetyl-CoA carboxylase biotin carboxyl carrier protein [Halotalea alkalilenta]|nr:acetyl-CoA carboxylase biotin carboxyl carrier protein subunit [Halotalea alkalilenta]
MDLLAHSDLTELTISEGDCTLKLVRSAGPLLTADSALPVPRTTSTAFAGPPPVDDIAPAAEICSPLYGVFHLTPAPGEPPFTTQGASVVAGQTLCVIEAMKMFHPLKTERAGIVGAILAEPDQEVEAGQPLFYID